MAKDCGLAEGSVCAFLANGVAFGFGHVVGIRIFGRPSPEDNAIRSRYVFKDVVAGTWAFKVGVARIETQRPAGGCLEDLELYLASGRCEVFGEDERIHPRALVGCGMGYYPIFRHRHLVFGEA